MDTERSRDLRATDASPALSPASGALAVAALAFAVRIPLFWVPLIADEGSYAYVARRWSEGAALYRDLPFDRPQLLFLLYRIILAVGDSTVWNRAAAGLYNAGTAAALFLLGRQLWGARPALVGAALFAVASAAPWIEGFTANAELFTALPIVLAAACTWRRQWFAAGLLAGAAAVIKPNGVSAFLLGLLWLRALRAPRVAYLRLLAGAAVLPAASLLHGLAESGRAFIDAFVGRRLSAYSFLSLGWLSQLLLLLENLLFSASSYLVLVVLAAVAARRLGPDPRRRFLLLWFASCWPGMALGGLWHPHYFQQLLPPLALLAGAALLVWRRGAERRLAVAVALAAALFVARDGWLWVRHPNATSWALYHQAAYPVAPALTAFVRARSRPDETIHVAFSQPELYFLTGRRPATSQLFWREVKHSAAIFDEVTAALQRGEPKLVVLAQAPPKERMSLAAFEALLRERYVEVLALPIEEAPGLAGVRDPDQRRTVTVWERRGGAPAPAAGAPR